MKRWNLTHSTGLALLLTCLAFCGCASRRQALELSKNLISASSRASQRVKDLQVVADQQSKNYKLARDNFDALHSDWQTELAKNCSLKIQVIVEQARAAIKDEHGHDIERLLSARHGVEAEFEKILAEQMKPWDDAIAKAHTHSQDAKAKSDQFPSDLDARAALNRADEEYVAAVGAKLDVELDARKQVVTALDQIQNETLDRLDQTANKYSAALDEQVKRASVKSARVDIRAPNVNPPAKDLDASVFNDLLNYTESVKQSGENLQEWFVLNSFSRGSFFDLFLKSFGSGLVTGVFNPEKVSGNGWSAAAEPAKALLDDISSDAKADVSDLQSTAKTDLSDFTNDAIGQLREKVGNTVSKFLTSKLGSPAASAKSNTPKS